MSPKRLLLLGGTSDAYILAERLAHRGDLALTTSLAGRSRSPRMPVGAVRIGGFGGVTGLEAYLRDTGIDAVIDATHPFARRMGWHAAAAAAAAAVPLLRLERPAWQPQPGDCWHRVPDTEAAAVDVAAVDVGGRGGRIFLTVGRQELAPFAAVTAGMATPPWFLIRTLDPPDPMPPFAQAHLMVARGPFTLAAEQAVLRDHGITALVSKNSGGALTEAKLTAARSAGLPVIMIDRPVRPPVMSVDSIAGVIAWIDGGLTLLPPG